MAAIIGRAVAAEAAPLICAVVTAVVVFVTTLIIGFAVNWWPFVILLILMSLAVFGYFYSKTRSKPSGGGLLSASEGRLPVIVLET